VADTLSRSEWGVKGEAFARPYLPLMEKIPISPIPNKRIVSGSNIAGILCVVNMQS
jgi:hypothetical protein